MSMTESADLELRALEQRRSDAMAAADGDTLMQVFAEDFILVHGDGTVDDRAGAIESARRLPRRVVVPRDLTIRVFGDTALLTGPVTLAIQLAGEERLMRVYIGQVARHDGQGWRFIWSQVTLSP
jgi:ketosteroid isomerase-like protein